MDVPVEQFDLRSEPNLLQHLDVERLNGLNYTSIKNIPVPALSIEASRQTTQTLGAPQTTDYLENQFEEFSFSQGVVEIDPKKNYFGHIPFKTENKNGETRGYGGIVVDGITVYRFGFAQGEGPFTQARHIHPNSPEGLLVYSDNPEEPIKTSFGNFKDSVVPAPKKEFSFIYLPSGQYHQIQFPKGSYYTMDLKIPAYLDRANGEYPRNSLREKAESPRVLSLKNPHEIIDPYSNSVTAETVTDDQEVLIKTGEIVVVVPLSTTPVSYQLGENSHDASISQPLVVYNKDHTDKRLERAKTGKSALILRSNLNPLGV
jgi:hypothetical protein